MQLRHILTTAAVLAFAHVASATVTLQFGQTGVARATGFANSAGTPVTGMTWGIIVDGSGNGFQAGSYDVFSSATTTDGRQLFAGGVATDDYYFSTGLSTGTATPTSDDPGGVGSITQLTSILTTIPSGIGTGDAFRIVWFETPPADGTFYGTFGDASFLLPSDGSTTSFASVFAGSTADPAKAATHQFVPEPSRFMLLGLALVGLIFRRRR